MGRADLLAIPPVASDGYDGRLPQDASRLAKLAALALTLTPLLEVPCILERAEPHLAQLLPGARGYMLLWHGEPRGLAHQVLLGTPPPAPLPPDLPAGGLSALSLANGALQLAHVVEDAPASLAPWEQALAEANGGGALVAGPLFAGGDMKGVLLLCCAQEPCDDDLLLMAAVCAAVSGSLQRAQSYSAAQSEKLAGMGRLTAAIAHEVNNPLQAISNSLHLLISHSLSEDKRMRYLSMAQKEVEQLIGVVRRMLDLSRPEREGMRPVSLHAALESVLMAADQQLREAGVAVQREWTTPLPRVSGVVTHLKHAFLNLVLACCASMPAGGTLVVRTGTAPARDGQGELVVVEFADSGTQLAEEELRPLFEPFNQTPRDASGMGLPVSYTIIEQHGGRLSVSSRPSGTTFRVELPALRA